MSTDKTLTDVQPGGRVRLGDRPTIEKQARELLAAEHRKCDRNTEADLVLAGDVTVLGQIALNAIIAALSAQPSPGGQGELAALVSKWRNEASAYDDQQAKETGFEVDWTYDAKARALDRAADELESALAARQPVGEPVGYWLAVDKDDIVEFGMSADDGNEGQAARQEVNDFINGALHDGGVPHRLVGVYAAPPVQAVDLGQFRRPIEEWRSDMEKWVEEHGDYDGVFAKDIADASRLLALIDCHTAGGQP